MLRKRRHHKDSRTATLAPPVLRVRLETGDWPDRLGSEPTHRPTVIHLADGVPATFILENKFFSDSLFVPRTNHDDRQFLPRPADRAT